MGIPSFFSHIVKNHKKILKKIGEFGHENYIKYLNNDDNSIFTKYFENLIKNIIK